MRELHADRSDADGTHIIVMDLESGEEFQIPIDSMLRTLVHPPEPAESDSTESDSTEPDSAEPDSAGVDSPELDSIEPDVEAAGSEADSVESPAVAAPAVGGTAAETAESDDALGVSAVVEPDDSPVADADSEDVPAEPATVEPVRAEIPTIGVPQARTLTPREIQARVRAGATVAELSQATGVAEEKINRFAHPVILERSRAAELARASHPMGVDGPATWTLGELVAECLVLRGQTPQNAVWDAWRTESGQWVVQVAPDPEVDVYAHWRFTLGSHGGTTDPMDDLAVELTEPDLARSYRRPTVVQPAPEPAPAPEPPTREVTEDGHEYVTVNADDVTDQQRRRRGLSEVLDLRYDDDSELEAPTRPAEKQSTAPRHRGKRATPTVPAWEDVLLGVRSHPNE